MATYYKNRKNWAVAFKLTGRPRQYVHGIRTEKLAQQIKAQKDLQEQLSKAGIHTPAPYADKVEAAKLRPIEEHIDEFEKLIRARGKNPQHAQQQASHVRRLFDMAQIRNVSQIEPAVLQYAAKRLMDDQHLAPRTANAAIKAVRQFGTWLYVNHITPADLLNKRLQTYNESLDQRRLRREMSEEEFRLLLQAAAAGPRRCGISGEDRAVLYQVAVGTGFRQRACLSLTKASFAVSPTTLQPCVILGPAWNKNRKPRRQPIRRDLADLLHRWLQNKPDKGPVWNPPPYAQLELMIKRDLEAARKKWLAEASTPQEQTEREQSGVLLYQDAAGRYADFHALRHTGISRVVRSAGLKAAQSWADHSTPLLTSKYAHLDIDDQQRALEGLPEARALCERPASARGGKIG